MKIRLSLAFFMLLFAGTALAAGQRHIAVSDCDIFVADNNGGIWKNNLRIGTIIGGDVESLRAENGRIVIGTPTAEFAVSPDGRVSATAVTTLDEFPVPTVSQVVFVFGNDAIISSSWANFPWPVGIEIRYPKPGNYNRDVVVFTGPGSNYSVMPVSADVPGQYAVSLRRVDELGLWVKVLDTTFTIPFPKPQQRW